MKIILIRHFKVDFAWRFAYNSQDYESACNEYDKSKIVIGDLKINSNNRIYSSTMIRAMETSEAIFNKAPDFYSDSLCEIPISPFTRTSATLPLWVWNIVGRIQWRFNSKRQSETYTASCTRIDKFMDSIIAQNEDCFIVAHGLVIKRIIRKLKKDHYHGLNPVRIKHGLPLEYSK